MSTGDGSSQDENERGEPGSVGRSPAAPAPKPDDIAAELTGDLPCVRCGYNLRNFSVLDVCSECGTPVRATILAVVDPMAHELKPIRHPWITAAGVTLWVFGAAVAMALCWPIVIVSIAGLWSDVTVSRLPVGLLGYVQYALALSAIGSVALWRPHPGITSTMTAGAVAGTAGLAGLAFSCTQLVTLSNPRAVRSISDIWADSASSTWFRVAIALGVALVLTLNRPVLRLLTARSLTMRMGRVDRQTLLAMLGSLGAIVCGDLLGLLGSNWRGGAGEFLQYIGVISMLGGLALFSLGLVGACADALRIAKAVLTPAPGVVEVFGPAAAEDAPSPPKTSNIRPDGASPGRAAP